MKSVTWRACRVSRRHAARGRRAEPRSSGETGPSGSGARVDWCAEPWGNAGESSKTRVALPSKAARRSQSVGHATAAPSDGGPRRSIPPKTAPKGSKTVRRQAVVLELSSGQDSAPGEHVDARPRQRSAPAQDARAARVGHPWPGRDAVDGSGLEVARKSDHDPADDEGAATPCQKSSPLPKDPMATRTYAWAQVGEDATRATGRRGAGPVGRISRGRSKSPPKQPSL